MSNRVEDQEDEEAALWVVRHMDGAVDVTAFSDWLTAAPGRAEKFAALQATMMGDDVAQGIILHQRQAQAYISRTMAADTASKRGGSNHQRYTRRIATFALAAAFVAVIAFSWPHVRFALMPAQSYQTDTGQIRAVTIADGSSITLNGASRISVKIGADRREIILESGEALFDVKHDPARPFVVSAGDGRVTVLGTRFDLALNAQQVDLEVERGLVRFEALSPTSANTAHPVLVGAEHRSTLANGAVSPPARYRIAGAQSWQNGWLEVADMPLAQIIPRLERWSDKSIIVRNNGLLRKRVAGRFHLSEPDVVLDNLAILYGFTVEDTGHAYILDIS